MNVNMNVNMSNSYLKSNFYEYLTKKIPILNDTDLFELITDYCQQNREEDKKTFVTRINTKLKKMYEITKNNIFNNNNIQKKNNKYLKIQKVNFRSLSEAIINVALKYYVSDSTINSITNVKNVRYNNMKHEYIIGNKNTKKIIHSMNIAKGKTLGLYIIQNLYVNSNDSTNQVFLKILQKIALKLEKLQKYNFIHGDFHAANIIINPNNTDQITFIDFGYSTIMLPDSKLILPTPMPENLSISMSFKINQELQCIDLFHLFRDFNSFDSQKFNSNIDYLNFRDFIDKILNKIKFSIPLKYSKVHNFTRSIRNFRDTIDLYYLYPKNFQKLNLEELNYLPSSSQKRPRPRPGNNNNNNNYFTKYNTIVKSSLFGNNNKNSL